MLPGQTQISGPSALKALQRRARVPEPSESIGTDVVEEIGSVAAAIAKRFSEPVFFGGQLIFPRDTFITRWLHNHVVFSVQRRLYHLGLPFLILPIRV